MTPQTGAALQTSKSNSLPIHTAGSDLHDRIRQMYDSIARRAYEIFEHDGRENGKDRDHWFRAESELFLPIRVEISETNQNIIVQAEVTGFEAKDLQINVEPNRLTLTGDRETRQEENKGEMSWTEHSATHILQVIDLPQAVDHTKATANLKDGVLRIELPKAEAAKPVRSQATAA